LVLKTKESDSPAPKSRTDFGQILLESVNEAIAVALGKPITPELTHHLQEYIGISADEIPYHIDLLFSSLRDSFGMRGDDLCKMVVRKMYEKAGVPFYEIAGQPMIHYVEELKTRLARTDSPASK
jgi:hypothetical protein